MATETLEGVAAERWQTIDGVDVGGWYVGDMPLQVLLDGHNGRRVRVTVVDLDEEGQPQ